MEALLGAPLASLTAEHIAELIAGKVPEADDLDYKRQHYDRDPNKAPVAIDVAALANHVGGLIIIGVQENDLAEADVPNPVDLDETHTRRIHELVATYVHPVPDFTVLSIPQSPGATTGYLLIAVPPSPLAPHAVSRPTGKDGGWLQYPRRNGATTRYLSEAEVAAAYVARTDRLARRQERVDVVARTGTRRLHGAQPWLVVTLVPAIAGDLIIGPQSSEAFQNRVRRWRDEEQVFTQAEIRAFGVGDRMLYASSDDSDHKPLELFHTLHTDGSCTYAAAVPWSQWGSQTAPDYETWISDTLVVETVLDGLHLLGSQSASTAAGGTAHIRLNLITTQTSPRQLALARSLAMGSARLGRVEGPYVEVEDVADLDDLLAPNTRVQVAARLTARLANAFGLLGLPHFQTDPAELRPQAWPQNWNGLSIAAAYLRDSASSSVTG